MNDLLKMLAGGDLRSDGHADQVAGIVLENPGLFDDLLDGVDQEDDVVRGRTAHSLEKVSRTNPELFLPNIGHLLDAARKDNLPAARWHYAMIFANLSIFPDQVDLFVPILLDMLADNSVFVKTWAVSSLTIIARLYPRWQERATSAVSSLENDKSTAVRSRARNSMQCLLDPSCPLPKGWVKSERHLNETTNSR